MTVRSYTVRKMLGGTRVKEQRYPETTSASLHILAMLFMLCDHLWATSMIDGDWLTCVGRIAFPIFAFLIVEGYHHTGNLKKYVLRLVLFALLSEIPFDLVVSGSAFYPFHQNVLWTFLISIGLIHLNELVKGRTWPVKGLTVAGTLLMGYLLGIVTMVDYYHAGILTVLAFYFFRGRKWWCYAGQLVSLTYINLELLGGLVYEIRLFGETVFLHQQGFALLALIPIWLYRGRQGHHSKPFRLFCYVFYPLHLLLLGLICLAGFNG